MPAPPPPPCTLDAATQAKLLALAAASPDGVHARGDWVAVCGFDVPWCTAWVTLAGVPAAVVGRSSDLAAYVAALHGMLARAYSARGLPMPSWRSWAALARRWPFVAGAQQRGTRVHVIRPL